MAPRHQATAVAHKGGGTGPEDELDMVTAANLEWLEYAREYWDVVQLGNIVATGGGGPTFQVNWNNEVPITPAWCDFIWLQCSVPMSITIPAGATATISPFAPYCMFAHNLLLGGAPPFATPVSGVPFWLDEMTSNWKLELNDNPFTGVGVCDQGPAGSTENFPWVPGSTVANTGTAAKTVTGTWTFFYRIRLRRRRKGMWGYVPLGDPENITVLNMFLNSLVGIHPEDNVVQDVAAAGITAATTGTVTVEAIWHARMLDQTPPNVGTLAEPLVGFGLSIDTNNGLSIQNAGQIQRVEARTAMVYEKIFHLVINNQQSVRPDYFGLWLTGQQQSARWEYDVSQNNFDGYYKWLKTNYQRYFPIGMMVADFESGEVPFLPAETPYRGLMSPDVGYAAVAAVAPTPAMYTAVRIPAGTSMNGAYVRTYSLGLVDVPY